MSRVTQTILHDPDAGAIGNCMQAAVASLLDLPLDDVPHFAAIEGDGWWDAFVDWCTDRQLTVLSVGLGALPEIPCLLVGKSPRDVSHMVVGIGTELAWDPHPSHEGLTSITGAYVLCPWLPWGPR